MEDHRGSQKVMEMESLILTFRFRFRAARAIAGVTGNFKHSHVNNMQCKCRLWSEGSEETQEHLQLCSGTFFERRGLDMSGRRGLVEFWRRITVKMAAAIWRGPFTREFGVMFSMTSLVTPDVDVGEALVTRESGELWFHGRVKTTEMKMCYYKTERQFFILTWL